FLLLVFFPYSCLERVLHQDRVLALRTGREQGDRASDQFFDSAQIFYRLRRQLRPRARARGRLLPARDGLVARLPPRLRALAGGKIIDFAAVEAVVHADFDFVEAVENVELGERKAVD